jgi:hypothetical protein
MALHGACTPHTAHRMAHDARGAGKTKSTDPPVHLLNPRPTHPPSDFFLLAFFLVRFWAFLGKGSSKTPQKCFCKKSMSKTFPKISILFFDVSFFLDFFWFYRVFGCFSAMGVQKHYKKRFAKQIASKGFYKKFDQKSKTDFFSNSFLSRFWAFLDEGSSKTR